MKDKVLSDALVIEGLLSESMERIVVTTGGKERLPQSTALLSLAFATDPVITYMIHNMSAKQRSDYMPAYFGALLTAAAMNSGQFDWAAAGDDGAQMDGDADRKKNNEALACCGVLMPPGKRVDNWKTLLPAGFLGMLWKIGAGGCMRMLAEFTPLTDAAKAKGLNGRSRYYYVFFLGTHPDAQRKGLASAIVKEYQARAAKEGVPLWLEATTAYSMQLYERLGFRIVEEMVLGKGKVDGSGLACKGGDGVPIWGMIWEAEEEVKEAVS